MNARIITHASSERIARRLIIVSPGGRSGAGGMSSVVREMSDWFERHRPDIDLVIVDPRGTGHVRRSPGLTAKGLLQIFRLKKSELTVLHLNVSERGSVFRKLVFALLGRRMGMRIILHHHGAELVSTYRQGSAPARAVTKAFFKLCDENVVLGDLWRKFLEDEIGVAKRRVHVVHNAIADLPLPQRQADPLSLLMVAELSPRKGVSEFLQSVASLRGRGVMASAVLAGAGQIERYRAEAEALGIGSSCRFVGWVDAEAVRRLHASASVFVLPSHDEGLPMAILEALRAGVPVVSTPVGSIPEVLDDGRTCLFTPVGDVEGLAASLERILTNPDLAATLSVEGRKAFEERFAIGAYMDRFLSIYGFNRI